MILLKVMIFFLLTLDPFSFDLECPLDNCAIVNQNFYGEHRGMDFGAPLGSQIYAAGDGIIYFAGESCKTYPCANAITMLHGDGVLATNYWHLDEVLVRKGDIVKQGDMIGTVGLTGITTGPHLHFSVQVNRVHVNPDYWINS